MERYHRLTLAANILKVNGVAFLASISRAIKFGTVELLANQKMVTVLAAVKNIHKLCSQRGFKINVMLMDGEFESIRGELSALGITLNTVSRDEHVSDAERRIRTLKERCRCMCNTLPFNKFPHQMIVQMLYSSNFWLNVFPPEDGVSDMNPRELITGMEINFDKHCQLEYGTYAQVHDEHDNSMTPRTTGALAMQPTGNAQGGYWFYSLSTGQLLNRNHWTVLPMPAEVVQRVHQLAKNNPAGVNFTSNRNQEYNDDNYEPDDEDDESLDGSITGLDESELDDLKNQNNQQPVAPAQPDPPTVENNEDAGNDAENNQATDGSDAADDDSLYVNGSDNNEDNDSASPDTDNENDTGVDTDDESANDNTGNVADENNAADDLMPANDDNDSVRSQDNADTEVDPAVTRQLKKLTIDDKLPEVLEGRTRSQNRNATVNVVTDDSVIEDLLGCRVAGVTCPADHNPVLADLEGIAMTQLNLKQGLKAFGEEGVKAVQSELKQLHDLEAVEPVHRNQLTKEQRKASLRYLMYLKQKRCGRIKGHGCADGRKQRLSTKKEDASSPTVAIESVMISCTIDAKEHRDVATCDIPGAFLQADMDEIVHVRLEGTMAELMARMDPKMYRKYVQYENGKPVLYVELLKALYGTLRASLLF